MLGIEQETEENFDKVMSVNVKGTFLVNRKFALMMKERKTTGSVVNISSVTLHGSARAPGYAATKGAVSSFTKSLALGKADSIEINPDIEMTKFFLGRVGGGGGGGAPFSL